MQAAVSAPSMLSALQQQRSTVVGSLRSAHRVRLLLVCARRFAAHALGADQPCIDASAWAASNAVLVGKVRLLAGSSVWFGATLRGDNEYITIGEGSNVQDGSVLHTDMGSPLTIGSGVTVGHLAMLHGCDIGDNCLVGIGSVILNDVIIGEGSVIGANTFIPEGKVIPAGSLVRARRCLATVA
jgi:carbonic anhydrase/acetyltransferase-like protein (isoleucine patch superfamily)